MGDDHGDDQRGGHDDVVRREFARQASNFTDTG
jgi:hypothetical protein